MRGGPWRAGWTRPRVPPGCASATGNHVHGLAADCSAGKSAYPWPRRSPRYVSHHRPAAMLFNCVGPQVGRGASHCWPARSPDSSSGSQPYRRLSGDCLRVLMRLRLVKPRVPQRDRTERISSPKCGQSVACNARTPLPADHRFDRHAGHRVGAKNATGMQQNCWQPDGKLLASGNAVSTGTVVDNEARMADQLAARTTSPVCLQHGDRKPLPVGCGTLRDRPFHTCG